MLFHVVACIFLIVQLVRFLRLFESCAAPNVFSSGSKFTRDILTRCKSLTEIYKPPLVWGKCGHIQTALYGKIGRFQTPRPEGERHYCTLSGGETVSYDIFQPLISHKNEVDYTILVCPGIANSSEKSYIRTFVQYAVERGYRVAVLNHMGSLPNVKLTRPKIFTYGDTKYFKAMVDNVLKEYKDSTFLMVGYSMGGNIVVKYLGEDSKHQDKILCAISLCQGYDAVRSTEPMKYGYRRIYNRLITENLKKIIKPHWADLFTSESEGLKFNEEKVKSAKCLFDLEDGLLRRIDGHDSVHEYMDKQSCCYVINNVKIPILLVNNEDDPVVVSDIHDIPKDYVESHPQAIFATFKFGGHLGYYTGCWYKPDKITLLEKMIVEYLESVIELTPTEMRVQWF